MVFQKTERGAVREKVRIQKKRIAAAPYNERIPLFFVIESRNGVGHDFPGGVEGEDFDVGGGRKIKVAVFVVNHALVLGVK